MAVDQRFFNREQKQALFIAASGKCRNCGKELDEGWHADHKTPYSKGGQTDVINGQALCPECNIKKGDSVIHWANSIQLRDWQERLRDKYVSDNKQDFLVVATPGAGKTVGSLALVFHLFSMGITEQLIIVCPSERLKRQWANDAAKFGIQIDPYWTGYTIKQGFHGVALTYQSIEKRSQLLRMICNAKPAVVLFDEIHHAGESMTWGDSIKDAFEPATKRIGLSGTPFRSDNNRIPFIEYEGGKSKANFSYGYGDALNDKVCRNLVFPVFDGEMSWFDGEDEVEGSFDDDMSKRHESQRLKTALEPGGALLRTMLKDADAKLNEVRQEDPTAAGLVIAMQKWHAEAIARTMTSITGETPIVVHSDNDTAMDDIESFSRGNGKWIVAVKMISEGVDIKRLRVGVYATNILTELYFKQAAGRVVRRQNNGDDWAWFYVPKDSTLVGYMEQIKREREHNIEINEEKELRDIELKDRLFREIDFIPVSADHRPDGDLTIADENNFKTAYAQKAQAQLQKYGIELPVHLAAMALTDLLNTADEMQAATRLIKEPSNDKKQPDWVYVEELRKHTSKQVRHIAHSLSEKYSFKGKTTGDIAQAIHYHWMKKPGNHKAKDAGLDELKRKKQWLAELLNKVNDGSFPVWWLK